MIFKVHLRNCTYSKLTHSYLHNYILKEMPCWIILGNTLEIVENADDLEGNWQVPFLSRTSRKATWDIGITLEMRMTSKRIRWECGSQVGVCDWVHTWEWPSGSWLGLGAPTIVRAAPSSSPGSSIWSWIDCPPCHNRDCRVAHHDGWPGGTMVAPTQSWGNQKISTTWPSKIAFLKGWWWLVVIPLDFK